jgi:hypothetical protein
MSATILLFPVFHFMAMINQKNVNRNINNYLNLFKPSFLVFFMLSNSKINSIKVYAKSCFER